MAETQETYQQRAFVPAKQQNSEYPVSQLHTFKTSTNCFCSSSIATRNPSRTHVIEGTLSDLDHSHFKRVCKYARTSDYIKGALTGAISPGLMLIWERIAPSYVGKGGFASVLRLSFAAGLGGGFLMFYQNSICTIYFVGLMKTGD